MKKILCPIDFSPVSINAIDYAGHVAQLAGMRLHLLHVQPKPITDPVHATVQSEELGASIEAAAYDKLGVYCKAVQEQYGIECEHEVLETSDRLEEVIHDRTSTGLYALVVMGTDGASDWIEFVFGSHAANTVSTAACPVIVVPESYVFEEVDRVLYATDYKQREEQVLDKVMQFTQWFDAHLDIVHIRHPDEFPVEELTIPMPEEVKHLIEDNVRVNFDCIVDKDPEMGLQRALDRFDPQLLVVLKGRHDWLSRFLHDSLSRQIVQVSDIPVLVFHV